MPDNINKYINSSSKQEKSKQNKTNIMSRLIKTVYPTNYKLHYNVDLPNFKFYGINNISIVVDKPTDKVTLHCVDLEIDLLLLNDRVEKFTEDKENETITVNLTKVLDKGKHQLEFTFRGVINDKLAGFYRSKYVSEGTTKYMASTQFEATDARRAFPCFDEPNFKATFELSLTLGSNCKDNVVLSNCPPMSTTETEESKTVVFEKTPIMSTYLLAFAVGDFEFLEAKTFNDIVVRAYCVNQPGNKEKIKFARDVAVRGLEWFIKWFEIDYPLKKLDLLGVPDFRSGAMENWGLITFKESVYYCDDTVSISEKQRIVEVILHELAHQWFGNLVTMEWWTYLWLNESMATYFGYHVTNELFPEWNVWDDFKLTEYQSALELDSLESSHPIEVEIKNSSDINQIFDAISYSKGSCIVKFMVDYLGVTTFQTGLRKYLNTHKYGNTVSDDLWDAMGDGIKDLMKCWTQQTGYPLLIVDQKGGKLELSQEVFYKQGRCDNSQKSKWLIPVKLMNNGDCQNLVLDCQSCQYDVSCNNLIVNPNRFGFYRVQYNTDVQIADLSTNQKIQLFQDNFVLSNAGYQNFAKSFDLLDQLDFENERDYYLLSSVVGFLEGITKLLYFDPKMYECFSEKTSKYYSCLNKILDQIGWDAKEKDEAALLKLRCLCIGTLAAHQNQSVVKEALKRFQENNWVNNKDLILPIVGEYTDEYDNLLKMYNECHNPHLKNSLVTGLCSSSKKEDINKSLEMILTNSVKSEEVWKFVRCLSLNKNASELVWRFVKDNYDKFVNKVGSGTLHHGYLVKCVTAGLTTQQHYDEYQEFFKDKMGDITMVIQQVNEKLLSTVKVHDRFVNDPYFKQDYEKYLKSAHFKSQTVSE